MSDRDLDLRLAAASGIRAEDLPALPESFLDVLRDDAGEHRARTLTVLPGADGDEPASVVAARQLADDARTGRRSSRRPGRRMLVRLGAGVVALAAAWAVAVVVAPSDAPSRPGDTGRSTTAPGTAGPDALDLVAAEEVTFPLSLDPPPPGLTPAFSRWGGYGMYSEQPLRFSADYSSEDGDRVLVGLTLDDPRETESWGTPAGTVTVGDAVAEISQAEGSVDLVWRRPDGRWIRVSGEGGYADRDALLPVARSVVDRPQPLDLQFGLAPVGWEVGGFEESRSIDLVSDAQPDEMLRLSLWAFGGDEALDAGLAGFTFTGPVEPVTIQGRPGRVALGDGGDGSCSCWYVVGQLPGADRLFLLLGSDGLTREQMLAMAEQVTYTP